jgi:hypothetical protein
MSRLTLLDLNSAQLGYRQAVKESRSSDMTEQAPKSPSKRRQRHITFPGSASRLLNEDQNDLDSQDRTRRFSLMDTLRSSDLADPLHGDLSFSMPHLGSGDRDEVLPSMDENERKQDAEEIELANMKARRRKTNTGGLCSDGSVSTQASI